MDSILTLDIQQSVTFYILVSPKASKNKLGDVHGGALKVYVTAAPEKGKANKAVCELLAKALDISVSQIKVIVGETYRRKQIKIDGVGKADVLKIIGESNED